MQKSYSSQKMTDNPETILIPIQRPTRAKYYLAAIASWFGSFAMGCVVGYTSPAIPSLQSKGSHLPITDYEGSWLGSLMAIGAACGGLSAGYSIETFGRKTTLLFLSIPFVAGWLLLGYAQNLAMLYCGRTITGFCSGIISLAAPVYIAETSDPATRGLLGAGFQLSVALGVLFTYIVGSYVAWSWLAVYCAIFPILLLLTMMFVPETPCWLMKKGRRDSAVEALQFLRGNAENIEVECQALEPPMSINADAEIERTPFLKEFFKMYNFKPFLICMGLMFFQQVSGVNAILFYTVTIFQSAGTSISANTATIYIGIAQVFATLASCLLSDKIGRRILLLFSGALMSASLLVMGIYFYEVDHEHKSMTGYSWIPLVMLMLYVIATAAGYSPLAWLLLSELLPVKIRGTASGICTFFNWSCTFLVTKEFDDMKYVFYSFGTYWFYSAICALSCVFVVFCLPETKGRSLKDIEAHFRGEIL